MKLSDVIAALLITLFLSFQGFTFDTVEKIYYGEDITEYDLEDEISKLFYIDTKEF